MWFCDCGDELSLEAKYLSGVQFENFTFSRSGQMTELDSSFRRGHEVPIDSMRGLN